ncbi:MAG: hypothetical protein QNJ31_01775 [Candidatus Caenarcaniphilales bacterium]|nr:hypothetical protein [Candidatus Caenarcaniphilales bacterium]
MPSITKVKEKIPTPQKSGKKAFDLKKGPGKFIQELVILAKAKPKEREINHVQFLTSVMPIVIGPLTLIALMCSNFMRDPNAKLPQSNLLKKALKIAAKSYQPLFELLTLNNIAIAVLLASPARLLTYLGLGVLNIFAMKDEWSMIDIVSKIRSNKVLLKEKKELLETLKLNDDEKQKLAQEIDELKKQLKVFNQQGADLHAKVGFFGRVIYNAIMLMSFLYYLPNISSSTRYGKLPRDLRFNDKDLVGPYKAQQTQGFTSDDFWKGHKSNTPYKNTPGFWQLLKNKFRLELDFFTSKGCPNRVIAETCENLIHPENAQGTLWGRNPEVEKMFDKKSKEYKPNLDNAVGKWRVRASSGLLPSTLNLMNVIARFGIIASSLVAVTQFGMNVFNRGSPFDSETKYQEFLDDESKPVGKSALNFSNAMIWNARMLSGVSGLLIAFNPAFAVSGAPALFCQGLGSGLSIASAIAGTIPGLSSVDLFTQFASSLVLWQGSALSNLTQKIEAPAARKIIDRELASKNLAHSY